MKYIRIVLIAIIIALASQTVKAADPQEMPTVKKQVTPVYPELLKKSGVEGNVWLKATVDETGKVSDVSMEKTTNKDFVQSAIDAVKQWEFNPGMKDGKPIKVQVMIPFNFKLDKDDSKSEDRKKIEDIINGLILGKVSDGFKEQVANNAQLVTGNHSESLASVLEDSKKRTVIIEGNDPKLEISSFVINNSKDTASLILKSTSTKSKKSRMHTIVLMKTDGQWKIQTWHISA